MVVALLLTAIENKLTVFLQCILEHLITPVREAEWWAGLAPASRRRRLSDLCELEASLVYTVRFCLNK